MQNEKTSFIIKGDIAWAPACGDLTTQEDGYLVVIDGVSIGVFPCVPEEFGHLRRIDETGRLIIPGMTDLHCHAPQYTFAGLGMDMELIDWLNTHAFPAEAKYAELDYARRAYERFAGDLAASPTTRASLFATLHTEATLLLMEACERRGLRAFAGKVNMDRCAPDILRESSADASLRATRDWLTRAATFQNVRPILTPRFIPSCSDELLAGLGQLRRECNLPVQSHLSENHKEIAWVAELVPKSKNYGHAYQLFDLFGDGNSACGAGGGSAAAPPPAPTVMAHCVHSPPEEVSLMKERGVYIAHCPQSNTNILSGAAPIRRYLDEGLRVGLGTDVAAGANLSLFRACVDAIQVSKLRNCLADPQLAPLTVREAFFLATKGGGAFFASFDGPAILGPGTFERGHAADLLVIDDRPLLPPDPLSVEARLERVIYLACDRHIRAKYVAGRRISGRGA